AQVLAQRLGLGGAFDDHKRGHATIITRNGAGLFRVQFSCMPDALHGISTAVSTWFKESFGRPTPPQAEGWPAIQRGVHTLILAPTGSGKTLAAFLWGLDELYRELAQPSGAALAPKDGVRLLYISPLKALNNDIER